jgi:TatD DNase family protein
MQLIDTHAHLQWPKFDEDRDEVVARAEETGVVAIVTLATDLQTSHKAIELAKKYPLVYAGVGIHPTDVAKAKFEQLQEIAELAKHPKVVAIGETGMDFYRDKTTGVVQEKFFLAQLEMSVELDLPVVIHNREAGQAILKVLEKMPDLLLKGVFHCFGEDVEYVQKVLDRGFHISFTGNLTYKKSPLPEIAKAIPLDRLLLETDSPFMAPVPKRGKRNEPSCVRYIAEKHAEIRGLSVEEICCVTTANARELFGIA